MKIRAKTLKLQIQNFTGPTMSRAPGLRRDGIRQALHDQNKPGALIIYNPPELSAHEKWKTTFSDKHVTVHVVVDPALSCKVIPPHQREVVKSMYDAVTGQCIENNYGYIMADEMGLGKTLQCITLLWTLLKQSPEGKPTITKGVIVCPSSLVKGHCLKNSEKQTYQSIGVLNCMCDSFLSGTPIQNLVHFLNQSLLSTAQEFKKRFENAIFRYRDADATDDPHNQGEEMLKELSHLVNRCIIRATSVLLTNYLPVKIKLMVVYCKSSFVQAEIYKKFISSNSIIKCKMKEWNDKKTRKSGMTALSTTMNFKKLGSLFEFNGGSDGFEETLPLLPANLDSKNLQAKLSKMLSVLDCILAMIRNNTIDKIGFISNPIPTVDLYEKLCNLPIYHGNRLDGSLKKRAKIDEPFNDPGSGDFAFLLSGKDGGFRLNLISANRLMLFTPYWNPANDDQVMARVRHDGQNQPGFVYLLLWTVTIEEMIFQRQAHKKALSSCVLNDVERHFSLTEPRDLFKLEEQTNSDTQYKFK